jgi:hypothetical protein
MREFGMTDTEVIGPKPVGDPFGWLLDDARTKLMAWPTRAKAR